MKKYSFPTFLKFFLAAGIVLLLAMGFLLLLDARETALNRFVGLLMVIGAIVLLNFLNDALGTLEIRDRQFRQRGLIWGKIEMRWDEVDTQQSDLGAAIPRLADSGGQRRIRIFPLLPEFREVLTQVRQLRADLWRFPQAATLYSNGLLFFSYGALFLLAFGLAGLAALEGGTWVELWLPGLFSVLMLVQLFRVPLKIDVAPGAITFYTLIGFRRLHVNDILSISLEEEIRSVTARKKVQIEKHDGRVVTLGGDLNRNVLYVYEFLQAWYEASAPF